MALLLHFPNPFHNLLPFPSSSKLARSPLRWETHRNPLRPSLTLWCSREQPSKKPKASRRKKSSEELCNELREFISTIGLPENRMPSLKELLDHGRKDLANVVRRRGYKAISELLMISNGGDGSPAEITYESRGISDTCQEESSGQEGNLVVYPECISSSGDSASLEDCNVDSSGAISRNTDAQVYEPSESSILDLQFKAAKFMQSGELDAVEDVDMNNALDFGSTILHSNNNDIAHMISHQLAFTSEEQLPERNGVSSGEGTNFDEKLASKASGKGNQNEINRLKALLHQKEIELSQLEQQIEEEKLLLVNLQAKAKAEIAYVQRTTAQKDVALREAEENLSGLKEVRIEYLADGEVVELAGSFNGWHHRIRMDLNSSSAESPSKSRQPSLWSAVLWLYPGVYEIKFIVNDSWRIDSQREVVSSGNVTNNVLRVDR